MKFRLITAALSATLALATPGAGLAQISEDGREIPERVSVADLEDQVVSYNGEAGAKDRVYRVYDNGECWLVYYLGRLIGYECFLDTGPGRAWYRGGWYWIW